MLAATLRRAGASRRVPAFVSQACSRSAFSRIVALRRRAPMTTTAAMAAASAQAAAEASAASTSTPTPKQQQQQQQQHRRFPPLAPGSVAPEEYEARLEEKVERVRSILAGVLPSSSRSEGEKQLPFPLEVFASPVEGFRLRAEFRVWHDGGDLYYVMFDTRDPSVTPPPKVRIDHFPVGPPMMNSLMRETLAAMREDRGEGDDEEDGGEEELEEEEEQGEEADAAAALTPRQRWLQRRKRNPRSRGGPLRRKLFQANFHTTLSGECIVTLIYHRNLGGETEEAAAWEAAARVLRKRLLCAAAEFGCRSVDVIGRSRGVARMVEKDHVQEELEVEFGGRRERGEEAKGAAAEPSFSSSPSSSSFSLSSFTPPRRRLLRYRQTEGSFSQPNGRVCEAMLGWAWKSALLGGAGAGGGGGGRISSDESGEAPAPRQRRRSDDLLELYCGNGNFTAALAPAFRRVVATEVSRSGVASAVINLKENASGAAEGGDDDVVVARADAERVAAALAALDKRGEGGEGGEGDTVAAVASSEEGEGETEKDAGETETETENDVFAGVVPTSLGGTADLSTYDLRTLFVDPPRAGVGAATGSVLSRFDRVLYVSCNPESLAADVEALVNGSNDENSDGSELTQNGTHKVTAAAVFDQFPYTDHIECGLLLERRRKEK